VAVQRRGLTQVLDLLLNYLVPIVLSFCCALASGWYGLRSFKESDESCRDLLYSALTGLGLAVGVFLLFSFWSLLDGESFISYLFPDMPVRRAQRGIYLVYVLGSYGIGTLASAVFLRLTGRCSQV